MLCASDTIYHSAWLVDIHGSFLCVTRPIHATQIQLCESTATYIYVCIYMSCTQSYESLYMTHLLESYV